MAKLGSITSATDITAGGGGGGATQALMETRMTAVAATIDAAVKTLRTAGYSLPGDGGHGLYRRLNAVPSAPTNPGYIRSIDRYKLDGTTDATHGGYWELVAKNEPLYLEQFGGTADYWIITRTAASTVNPSPTDNLAAFNFAQEFLLTYINNYQNGAQRLAAGPTIRFGYGGYYFSDELVPTKTIRLEGAGTGYYHDGAGSRLYFAAGKRGIVLKNASPVISGVGSTSISHLFIASLGFGGQTTKHGIEVDTPVSIEHCSVVGFGGNGIDITADVTGGTNANGFYLSHLIIYNNAGDGVFCQGGDFNAGSGYSLNCAANGGYGINDSSFLGNPWYSCHTATNAAGSYYLIGSSSRSALYTCYSESDQPPAVVGTNTLVMGGLHAAGVTLADGALVILNDSIYPFSLAALTADNIFRVRTRAASNVVIRVQPESGGFPFDFRFENTYKLLGWNYNNSLWINYLTTEGTTLTQGRSAAIGPGKYFLPDGFWLGGHGGANVANGPRFLGFADAAPTTGAWAVGDKLFNMAPTAGGSEGWVCVTAGTPGTWKTFGAISA